MKRIIKFLPLFLFLFLTIFLFRQYVFFGKVPFAGNLLAAFYEPWKSYPNPNYPSGPANKPIGFDSLRIFYPLRSLTIDSFKHFQLPLWNPYDFAGNTQLATYQTAVFFPLTFLYFILPQVDAWSLTVLLGPLLASIFMYYFLQSLSLSKKSSVIGALAFGFSGTLLVLIEESWMSVYSLLVLPLLLLGIYRFFKEGKLTWFSLIVLALFSSILSGWFQSTFYVGILSFVWSIFLLIRHRNLKRFVFIISAFIIAILLSGPHLIPNIESYLYSARGTSDAKFVFNIYLLPPWHLITYFAPDFFGNPGTYNYFGKGFYYEKVPYIGIVGLFLGLVALFKYKKTAEEWFFTICWIVTVSLALSIPTSWFFLYDLHIPLLSTILPTRIFLISAFCLSVMAAFGLENLLKKPNKFAYLSAILVSLVSLGVAWNFLHQQKLVHPLSYFATVSYHNMILPIVFTIGVAVSCFILLFKNKLFKLIGFSLLLLLSIVGISYFANKYLYFSERYFTYPSTPVLAKLSQLSKNDRIWSYGDGYMERNFSTFYKLQNPEGYDSFYIKTYGEFIEASQNGGKLTKNTPRVDAQLTGISKLSEIFNNKGLIRALNLTGVKYIFAKRSAEDDTYIAQDTQHIYRPLWTDGTYIIYQNTSAFPRVYLMDSYKVITNPAEQLATIFADTTDLSKTIILSEDPHFANTNTHLFGKATIRSYTPEKVTIQTTTNKSAFLFLSDNNYPGWEATIDGEKTTIFTAYHTFRSVIVPQGQHTVVFTYQPKSVTVGFYVCLVGILLFVVIGFTIRKKKV